MLTENELRFLIKKKLMLKEGLLPGSGAGQNAGVPPVAGDPPTRAVTSTGGSVPTGGASVPPFFSSTGTNNDEKDFNELEKVLKKKQNLNRPDMDTAFADQEHADYQKDVVAAIMKEVDKNRSGAEEIFGQNIEEKINQYYTKKLTTKDLFADSDPVVQANLATMKSKNLVRYDPAAVPQTTWTSGPAQPTDNFPFFWLKLMIDKGFDLSEAPPEAKVDPNTGYPLFNNKDTQDFNAETSDLYTDVHDKFVSGYEEYLNTYYDLRAQTGSTFGSVALSAVTFGASLDNYFDNKEALAYGKLLYDLIDKDYDQENLPMTRMFFARIAAEDMFGYGGGGEKEEAMAVFAVGEDHRVRDHFDGGNDLASFMSDPSSILGGAGGIAKAAEYYDMAYRHVAKEQFGSKSDVALDAISGGYFAADSNVAKTRKNLSIVIKGILERKMDGSAAKSAIKLKSYHTDAYNDEVGVNLFIKDEEADSIKESRLREIVRKHLLTEKAATGTKNVGLNAEFESLVDPNGYIFVHFGKSKATISPMIYTKPKGGGTAKRAPDLYRLCYYSPNWIGAATNPLDNDPFDLLFALYKTVALDDGFDLNNVAAIKASKIIQIGKKLQAGTDPYGIKTAPMNPAGTTPPSGPELTAYQAKIVSEPWVMEAMRIKEVANAMFAGIRKDMKGDGGKFLKYLESEKSTIMIGKNLDITYEKAMEQTDPREADAIKKMYIYMATEMQELTSGEQSGLQAERDKALVEVKMELDNIKTAHPLFHKAFLILMQKKIKKGSRISYDIMTKLADDFENSAPSLNMGGTILGLYQFFLNLKKAADVPAKERVKIAAVGGKEVRSDQFMTDVFNKPETLVNSPGNKSDYTFQPAAIENAMSEFTSMLKDSDNTLTQPLIVTIQITQGGSAPNIKGKIKKIEGRGKIGQSIKLGLRKWVKTKFIPAIDTTTATPHEIIVTFPTGRYIGKGLMEEDVTRELIKLIREYSS